MGSPQGFPEFPQAIVCVAVQRSEIAADFAVTLQDHPPLSGLAIATTDLSRSTEGRAESADAGGLVLAIHRSIAGPAVVRHGRLCFLRQLVLACLGLVFLLRDGDPGLGLHLVEFCPEGFPICENVLGTLAVGGFEVTVDQALYQLDVVVIVERDNFNHLVVVELFELILEVEDKGQAAAHAGAEVLARAAEDEHGAVGHVLAAVIADTFDDRCAAGIANAKPFTGLAVGEQVTTGGSIHDGVAHDGVVGRGEFSLRIRADDDFTTAHALADVVVGFPGQGQANAAGKKGAEALTGAAAQLDVDGAVRQAVVAVYTRDFTGQLGADIAVGILDLELGGHRLLVANGAAGRVDDLVVERVGVHAVVAIDAADPWEVFTGLGGDVVQQLAEVEGVGFRMTGNFALAKELRLADQVVELAHAERCHDLAGFLGDRVEEVDHVFDFALELGAVLRIGGGHPYRAIVEMTAAHVRRSPWRSARWCRS